MWTLGILSQFFTLAQRSTSPAETRPSLPLPLVSQLCSMFRSLALRPASVLDFLSPTPLFLSYEDFCGGGYWTFSGNPG